MSRQDAPKVCHVLFLCTGNSARSVLAEALLNHFGRGKFVAFSAGSHPTGKVNPFAIETLRRERISVGDPRSKSWDEFSRNDSPPIDIVITVCGNAASEVCPIWRGHPLKAHWGIDDPAAAQGSDEQKSVAFHDTFVVLKHRVEVLVKLDVSALDSSQLEKELARIGESFPT